MHKCKVLIPLIFFFPLPTATVSGLSLVSDEDAFVAWSAENAVLLETLEPGNPYDDLHPIKKIVGDARIVCLGESRHDIHEHFRFKHRMIEFLVKEMGFTLFAMEESLPCAGKINEYILGGEGDPAALLNSMGGWYIWDTEEVLALIEWMREYNETQEQGKKIRFYGFDITEPLLGLENVLAYLDKVDTAYAADFRGKPNGLDLFSKIIWTMTMENYKRLSDKEREVLGINFEQLLERFKTKRSEFIKRSSEREFDWIFRQALVVKQANDLFSAAVTTTLAEAGIVREKAMADHIRWILNREGGNERLVVWAHNFHVVRSALDIDIPDRPPTRNMISMTNYLSEEMGKRMVSFGFSFSHGEYPGEKLPEAGKDTLDGVLARVGPPRFIIDLRAAPGDGPVAHFLDQKMRMRGQGGFAELVPGKAFDALIFTSRITRAKPTPLAQKRFQSLQR